jgi:glycosyltransferase involved in cell wall biosynthesis
MSQSISVLILSHNDQECIRMAINSVVNWSNDIVVLDSNSSDETENIVKSFVGVRFIKNAFKDFSSQRNFGLKKIQYKNEWLFMLDSDEQCSPELQKEMIETVSKSDDCILTFSMRRKDFFNGKYMRAHIDMRFTRLMRHSKVSFSGIVHEKLYPDTNCVKLESCIIHYPFCKGINDWVTRHSRYAVFMAELEINNRYTLKLSSLFSRNTSHREKAKKALFQKLPGRFFVYFIYKYVYLKAFLDGTEGFIFVLLETFYHVLVVANIRYLKKNEKHKNDQTYYSAAVSE